MLQFGLLFLRFLLATVTSDILGFHHAILLPQHDIGNVISSYQPWGAKDAQLDAHWQIVF